MSAEPTNYEDMADRIRRLRLERGWTQTELAQHCGVTKATVSGWECGISTSIRLKPLMALLGTFDISLEYLLEGKEAMNDEIDRDAVEAQRIANRIKPLLAGSSPEVMGAALAELLSLWLAGHYQGGPELIERMLELHIEVVRKLVPVNIKILEARSH